MSPTSVIFVVLLASIAISFGLAALIIRHGRRRAEASLAPVGTPSLSAAATALGRTGDEEVSLTSTGTLVLTEAELAFAQWRPARLLRIPRADITATEPVREHLGKTMRSDVLRIAWQDSGEEQEVAFFVRDIHPWLATLTQ